MCDHMKMCALIPSLTVESMIAANDRIDFFLWSLYLIIDILHLGPISL